MKDEEVADNFLHVYNSVLHSLPQEKDNIKSVIIKMSMGSPVQLNKEYKQEEISLLVQKPKVKKSKEEEQ